ncbi:FAD-dependent monooxygenase [Candidatus Sumerlaeota bacterium]|nr:FAD-dependent monooxygenase [Candidatus Sumerlaeota bacterium]
MTAAPNSYDTVVAGAGLAGSCAALLLASRGRSVLLADKARFPRDKVCGCCLNGESVSLLRAHGIDLMTHAEAIPITEIEVRHRSSSMLKPVRGGAIIPRATLDQLLVKVAVSRGAHFLDARRVSVATRDAERISLHCGNEVLHASLLIEATGLASRVDEHGTEVVGSQSHLGAAATYDDDGILLPRGRISMHVGNAGYVGLVRFADGRIHAAAAVSPALVKECGSAGGAAKRILESCGRKASPSIDEANWKGTPLLTRCRSSFYAHRQLTIGDAAGYVEPFTGEGIAWALRSATNIVPFAITPWSDAVGRRWDATMRGFLRRRQRTCRAMAWLLRKPGMVRVAIQADSFFSPLFSGMIQGIASGQLNGATIPKS